MQVNGIRDGKAFVYEARGSEAPLQKSMKYLTCGLIRSSQSQRIELCPLI
ncbi:hypothetical protein SAMN05216289_105170 [Dokdonella immobilis]|uniref:Uncharacterized protein n=1 Tax=Dokdonella immobilis TaxID=578942 RepID=A0A1I4WNT0_9GAMM|nr:hypothetical protein SAMN05216289_105170 [Dokdonella immobilis]